MIFKIINEQVRQNCIREILALPLGKCFVDIKPAKRNLNQNALYWKWCEIIGDDIGYTKDEMHEHFAVAFLGVTEKQMSYVDDIGEQKQILLRKPKSTKDLTKSEFSEYMTKVEIFAATQEIALPQPNYYGLE